MTARDAAALIIASVTSSSLQDTVEALQSYSSLPAYGGGFAKRVGHEKTSRETLGKGWNLRMMPIPQLFSLGEHHTFGQFLPAIIEAAMIGEIQLAQPTATDIRKIFAQTSERSPHVSITMYVPVATARVVISTTDWEEWRTYTPIGSETSVSFVGNPAQVDLVAEYSISDRTLYAVSQCLKDEPLPDNLRMKS